MPTLPTPTATPLPQFRPSPLARALADWAVTVVLRAWRSGQAVCVGCGREWTPAEWAEHGRCARCGCQHKSERAG